MQEIRLVPELAQDRHQLAIILRWRTLLDLQVHYDRLLLNSRAVTITTVIALYGGGLASAANRPLAFVGLGFTQVHVGLLIVCFGMGVLSALFAFERLYIGRMQRALHDSLRLFEAESGSAEQPLKLDLAGHLRVAEANLSTAVAWLFYGVQMVFGFLFVLRLGHLR